MKAKRRWEDLSGKKFGRWTVLERSDTITEWGHIYYWCKCECGYKGRIVSYTLRNGMSQSCGCRQREIAKVQLKKNRKNRNQR